MPYIPSNPSILLIQFHKERPLSIKLCSGRSIGSLFIIPNPSSDRVYTTFGMCSYATRSTRTQLPNALSGS